MLGYGAHPDPAAELAPGIAQAIATAHAGERDLTVVAVVVGTDADPQDMDRQIAQLAPPARKCMSTTTRPCAWWGAAALGGAVDGCIWIRRQAPTLRRRPWRWPHSMPLAAVNVGLESFTASLEAQGAGVVQVDWRPPAGGNERLAGILARMKRGG
ncbi:MAG: hypothetical protein R2854_17635 [Caldilineaceae bacterium]